MKLRSTTPASKSFMTKPALIFISLVIATAIPIQVAKYAAADSYDDRINALQRQIDEYNAQAKVLAGQAATLKSAIGQLQNEEAVIQAQINLSQAKYDKITSEIADTEKKIQENQDALGTTIANMYVDNQVTPIEMLASSKNIGDYIDKQEYSTSIRDQLSSTISKIKELKKTLEKDQADAKTILEGQKSQKAALAAKEADQQALLAQTNNSESAYQSMIGKNQSQIAALRATQAEAAARYNSGGGYSLVSSGLLTAYPWNSSNCPMAGFLSTGGSNGDGGDGRGYGCRQCASYVAWRIAKETGRYYSWGNAVNFTSRAVGAGYSEGAPQAGSIAVMDPGTAGNGYGHVAWVEAVSGNKVLISQYNYNYGAGFGLYSEMWLSAGAFDHYVHIL